MDHLQQEFNVRFSYKVHFTSGIFNRSNETFHGALAQAGEPGPKKKMLIVIDEGVTTAHPSLQQDIVTYFEEHQPAELIGDFEIVPGGESAKNKTEYFDRILYNVNRFGVDRHSYLTAIGGGSVLDMAGYAAAVAHRGIRHIRIPTTVLSQNDSGIGVKNSLNFFGKKNFLGTFAPPFAVFNDEQFLTTLDDRNWRSGIAEAVKVALIKDSTFFEWLEQHADELINRNLVSMNYLVKRCAALHLQHIAGSDPFESGSSRPLDFGHWSAHKLEQLSNFEVLHGEAVAMGIAVDTVYSALSGRLSISDSDRVVSLLQKFGFALTHPLLNVNDENSPILQGLKEFREHLGGRLTIMLLNAIGTGIEVHEIDAALVKKAVLQLNETHKS